MNIKLCQNDAMPAAPYFSYYQSDWTPIRPGEVVPFIHNFNTIPSFFEVYATTLDGTPTSAVPYLEWQNNLVKVPVINITSIVVANHDRLPIKVRVGALVINSVDYD